ncbi:MAG: DNA polymerase III subunit chi [Methylococcales bacterium]
MANTRVDFYILQSTNMRNRQEFACKLTEKAYRLGHKVFIRTDSPEETRQLDNLLWTFRAGSFIPHTLKPEDQDDGLQAPIQLGTQCEGSEHLDLLINLSAQMPSEYTRFKRIAELIDQNDPVRESGRQHYRQYQREGCELTTHKL